MFKTTVFVVCYAAGYAGAHSYVMDNCISDARTITSCLLRDEFTFVTLIGTDQMLVYDIRHPGVREIIYFMSA